MRPHMDNINNPFGYTSAARPNQPTWETARPQPPPRRRANSLQHNVAPTMATTASNRPTRRSLFNTTAPLVCLSIYLSACSCTIDTNCIKQYECVKYAFALHSMCVHFHSFFLFRKTLSITSETFNTMKYIGHNDSE